jgi:hypothetical protein
MTAPVPIDTAASNTQACGGANAKVQNVGLVPQTKVFAGDEFPVQWPRNGHNVRRYSG